MDNGNLPAHPLTGDAYLDLNGGAMAEGSFEPGMGMTKREAFAMAAMQGLLANSEPTSWSDSQYYDQISKQAVNHADKLLAELSK